MTIACRWCHDTGWMTLVDYDGSGYDVPCDCAAGDYPATYPSDDDAEVPF